MWLCLLRGGEDYALARQALTQRRVSRRRQNLILDTLHDSGLRFGLIAFGNPFGIAREGMPLLFALRQALPPQHVGQRMIARTDQRGPEDDLPDAVSFPKPQRDAFEAGVERVQAAGTQWQVRNS